MINTDIYQRLLLEFGADVAPALAGMRRLDSETEAFAKSTQARIAAAGQAFQSLGRNLTVGVTLPMTILAKQSLDAYARLDDLKRGLVSVMGSASKAEAEISRLKKTAELPGLGFPEAIEGSIRLQATGMSADGARAALEGFGNALATVGGGKAELQGVILALGQIQAKGKVSAEEINQIAERVPQIRQIMQQAFGTANTEQLQKMGINSRDFVARIVGELQKLPSVSSGFKNSMENLDDTLLRTKAAIGEALAPTIIDLAGVARTAAESFGHLSRGQKQVAVEMAGIVAISGPVLLALSSVAQIYAAIKQASSVSASNNIIAQITNLLKTDNPADKVRRLTTEMQLLQVQSEKVKAGSALDAAKRNIGVVEKLNAAGRRGGLLDSTDDIQRTKASYDQVLAAADRVDSLDVSEKKLKVTLAETTTAEVEVAAATTAATGAQVANTATNTAAVGTMATLKAGLVGLAAGFRAAVAAALPMLAIATIVSVLAAMRSACIDANGGLDAQADSLDEVNKRLEKYKENLDAIATGRKPGQPLSGSPKPKEQAKEDLLKEIKKQQDSFNAASEAAFQTDWYKKEQAANASIGASDRGRGPSYIWGNIKAGYKSAADWVTGDPSKAGYDSAMKSADEAKQKLDAAKAKLKELGYNANGAMQTFAASVQSQEDTRKAGVATWRAAAIKAEKDGDEAGKAWADINKAYADKLLDNVQKAAKDPTFDKAAADKEALEDFQLAKIRNNREQETRKREAAHFSLIATLDAGIARAKAQGDEAGFRMLEIDKAYKEAIDRANETDSRTGKYRYDAGTRKAMHSAAADERLAAQRDAAVAEYKRQLGYYVGGARLGYESYGVAASSRYDEMGQATALAYEQYASDYQQAMEAQADRNPNWKRMLEVAEQKRAEAIRKAKEEARQKADREAMAERTASYALLSGSKKAAAESIAGELERTTDPRLRLAATSEIAKLNQTAAATEAQSRYAQTMADLQEQERRGVDVTRQKALALQELTNAQNQASRESRKAVEQEVEAYRQRREQMIGFTSLTQMWQRNQVAGQKEEFALFPERMKQSLGGASKDANRLLADILRELRGQTGVLNDAVGAVA